MVRVPLIGRRGGHDRPGAPHRFHEPSDPGIGAIAGGGFGASSRPGMNNVLMTSAYMREQVARPDAPCGLKGCGRPRHHPVHEAPEEA